ncbi:unnamed protein product, partial [Urochloa humidicola]
LPLLRSSTGSLPSPRIFFPLQVAPVGASAMGWVSSLPIVVGAVSLLPIGAGIRVAGSTAAGAMLRRGGLGESEQGGEEARPGRGHGAGGAGADACWNSPVLLM